MLMEMGYGGKDEREGKIAGCLLMEQEKEGVQVSMTLTEYAASSVRKGGVQEWRTLGVGGSAGMDSLRRAEREPKKSRGKSGYLQERRGGGEEGEGHHGFAEGTREREMAMGGGGHWADEGRECARSVEPQAGQPRVAGLAAD